VRTRLNLADVIKNHEKTVSGKRTLYIQRNAKKKSSRLLVVMSAHNYGDKYMAMRSFLEKQVCDLLFITDPKNTWYLDNDNGKTYEKVITNFSSSYKANNVFLFGSSMSGYGAILHALKLNLNAIASNPQINLDITKDYSWPELVQHINDIKGNHTNIEKVAASIWKDSAIYVTHGHDDIDVINAKLLLKTQPDTKKLIVQTVDVDSHVLHFGKNIQYIYHAMDMLAIFRDKLDLSTTVESLTSEAKNIKKSHRLERHRSTVVDPYRSLSKPANGILWQDRYNHEIAGNSVNFGNIGFYDKGSISGATCFFDGKKWRLTSIPYESSDNLISALDFSTSGIITSTTNNASINDFWWLRNEANSKISVSGQHNFCEISITETNSHNIFLHTSIPADFGTSQIRGQFLTFTADVYTSEGQIHLTLGGVSDSGYHHKNSDKCSTGKWTRLMVLEQFTSVNSSHKDRIFVRFNLASDGKSKIVRIKNACLTVGYFPMGFTE